MFENMNRVLLVFIAVIIGYIVNMPQLKIKKPMVKAGVFAGVLYVAYTFFNSYGVIEGAGGGPGGGGGGGSESEMSSDPGVDPVSAATLRRIDENHAAITAAAAVVAQKKKEEEDRAARMKKQMDRAGLWVDIFDGVYKPMWGGSQRATGQHGMPNADPHYGYDYMHKDGSDYKTSKSPFTH